MQSFPYNYFKKRKFINFSNEYLNISKKRFKSLEELKEINNDYDYFICGSDQIWNGTMIRFDSAYFLSFVDNTEKKIAYAASFGKVDISDQEFEFYKRELNNINKISVRETSASVIVKKCSNKFAEVVLDPTLLLSGTEWKYISRKEKVPKEPYILTYCLSNNKEMQDFIKKLRLQTGYKVIGISRGLVPMFRECAFAVPSPLEFVQLFSNASYVVTNSFHGTAFSTNLNKNFFTFIKGERNTATNSRIVDFLENLGLADRIYTKCPKEKINISQPNFEEVNKKLEALRKKSINFLTESLDINME
ncbi:MAG: polysaccharide pyruvyl transferase family protein [Epulopiscium sp.]|nr:polysaccharide pyruvyl transferase family protein [Candidatus Epulonipiscium sp.]